MKYDDFYNYSLELLSDDGIIIADNVLYKGYVNDPPASYFTLCILAAWQRITDAAVDTLREFT